MNDTTGAAADATGAVLDTPGLAERFYTTMRTIRSADERFRRALSTGEIATAYWPVTGHEAISAGVGAALGPSDQMVITYRGLANAIAAGVPLEALYGELFGRQIGLSAGKAGPMGLSAPAYRLMLSTGIVGAGAPIANGVALAQSMRGRGEATVVSFGDGATSIGSVHEAMNLAAVWDLPVVFMCENNQYGEHTPVSGYTRITEFAQRAAGYGMLGETVDGTDPWSVYEATSAALTRARSGHGPTFIEAVTFRLEGHYFGDAMKAVDAEARQRAWANEPMIRIIRRIQDDYPDLAARLPELDAAIANQVEAAAAAALASPEPDLAGLTTDVCAGSVPYASDVADEDARSDDRPTRRMGLAEAVNDALAIALSEDDRVLLLGEDIADPVGGTFTATAGLSTKFGEKRVRATPISEAAIVGAATGAAISGYRPVAELMFMDFLGVCYDQLANHAAKIRYLTAGRSSAPLTLRTVVGTGNGPQHSQSWEALLTHIPGIKVVWPSTSYDAKGLLLSCIADPDPCVFIESMALYFGGGRGEVPADAYRIPLGRAAIRRPGDDVTVVSWGPTVLSAAAAAAELDSEGISVEVIDLRTLMPLDIDSVVESVTRTGRLVVVHQAVEFGGFGGELVAAVSERAFGALKVPVIRLGSAFTPVPHAPGLSAAYTPSTPTIVAAIRKAVR